MCVTVMARVKVLNSAFIVRVLCVYCARIVRVLCVIDRVKASEDKEGKQVDFNNFLTYSSYSYNNIAVLLHRI